MIYKIDYGNSKLVTRIQKLQQSINRHKRYRRIYSKKLLENPNNTFAILMEIYENETIKRLKSDLKKLTPNHQNPVKYPKNHLDWKAIT